MVSVFGLGKELLCYEAASAFAAHEKPTSPKATKTMKTITHRIVGAIALCMTGASHAQTGNMLEQSVETPIAALMADVFGFQIQTSTFRLVAEDQLPDSGSFWLAKGPYGKPLPPYPCLPSYLDVPIYDIGNGQFLVDDSGFDYGTLRQFRRTTQYSTSTSLMPPDDGEGGGDPGPDPTPDTRRNYEKFMAHLFSVIDTNAAAQVDINLYNACISFPPDTNTSGTLQIMKYGTNAVIIKANHFDYSAETERDFALLICDSVDKPLRKTVDFTGASDAQDGWLIQGMVPRNLVADPMFLLVSNIAQIDKAFFRAIPYGGPQIGITGAQPFDVVSNTITLQATINDLSGVTNVQFELNVDGASARYSLGTNNTISIETKYNPNGIANIYLKAFSKPRIFDPANLPDNAKLVFSGIGALPVDFENDTFLAFASDYASPDIGTNYVLYVIDKAQQVEARIFNPANNQTLASFGGYVPFATTIAIPWNFTLADHVTPYTNDTYGVHFVAYDPTTLDITNKIDREGVRTGAGCYLTYQEEDPFDLTYGPGNIYLNDQANTWIKGALKTLYKDLYKPTSLTQYTTSQVGTNRNHSDCIAQDLSNVEWAAFLQPALSNSIYSDFTLAQAHGNGYQIGGGTYFLNRFTTWDLMGWLKNYGPYWRLRKAAIWSCWSGADNSETGELGFGQACGMRPMGLQARSYMRKNCGLFFGGKVEQAWVTSGQTVTTAKAAAFLDQAWVCGQFQWPGGCDPTYAFEWAVRALLGQYPEMNPNGQAQPRLYGYPSMIYASVYDDELMLLDETHVKHN